MHFVDSSGPWERERGRSDVSSVFLGRRSRLSLKIELGREGSTRSRPWARSHVKMEGATVGDVT